ncbi:MAG: DUF4230 domain-containing protein [Synergistaceae bacterium]|nr:DUF4230 domain-containing protein [Synergistaceae bacterium]
MRKKKPFEKQIRELHEIATLEANYMVMVKVNESNKIFFDISIPGTSREVLMSYKAVAVWSCNMDIADIYSRDGLIRIVVPHCNITRLYLEPKSKEVYRQSSGIFTSIQVDEVNFKEDQALDNVKEKIITEGKQQVQADRVLKNILHAITGALAPDDRIEIMFNDETEANLIPLPKDTDSIPSPNSPQFSHRLKQ